MRTSSKNFKLDEIRGNIKYLEDFRNAGILCFTETWWDGDTNEDLIKLDGFGAPYRADRNLEISGKDGGGGVAIYVNERWCKKGNINVRKLVYTPDCEVICMSFRPVHLPRDYEQVFYTGVYVHPRATGERAAQTIADAIDYLHSIDKKAPCFVLCNINRKTKPYMKKTLPSYSHYVDCNTRKEAILDMCYGNIKGAYRAIKKPPISTSDHNAILLLPTYETKLKREGVDIKETQLWSTEVENQNQVRVRMYRLVGAHGPRLRYR